MTRSLLRPIRTRRVALPSTPANTENSSANSISPGTRKTLASIGALWVSFAVSASANTASAKPAALSEASEAQGVVFLATGKRLDSSTPRPPMPPYRMNAAGGAAVVADLKSLSK